jgi:hypothetical protein
LTGTHRIAARAILGALLCAGAGAGLDPVADRKEIEKRELASRVGALLAYLKTR